MNILIYTSIAFKISETFILNQFKFQKKHELIGLCHNKQEDLPYKIIKISAVPVNFIDRLISFLRKRILKLYKKSFSAFTEKQIKQILKENKIDLIHCNYGTNALKFLHIIKKTNIPLIVHFHGVDASKSLKNKTYTDRLPELFKLAKKVIVVSEDMKKRLIPFFNEKDQKKISLIPYGVDLDNIINNKSEKEHRDYIKVLHVGRLTPKKGVPDLTKVFIDIIQEKKINAKLHIIGDGEELELVQNIIDNNDMHNHIIMHGPLSHEKVIKHMNDSDIFVLNSRIAPNGDQEGFPNVIIEAMAAENAVISTYHAGIPMALTNEKEGLLVEEKNNFELKKAIVRLLQNEDERIYFSKNAKERALTNFSIEKAIGKYNEIYESIINIDNLLSSKYAYETK